MSFSIGMRLFSWEQRQVENEINKEIERMEDEDNEHWASVPYVICAWQPMD